MSRSQSRIPRAEAERDDAPPQEGAEGTRPAAELAREAEERRAQLEDPKVQFRINNPDELGYTLRLERDELVERRRRGKVERVLEPRPYERQITIRVALTPRDVQGRGVVDLIESHYKMVKAEVEDLLNVQDPNMAQLINARPGYVEAAMTLPAPRNLARRVIVAMGRPADESDLEPITLKEVALGMDSVDLTAFQVILILKFWELVKLAKKTRARPWSGRPTSTRRSTTRTGGRAR